MIISLLACWMLGMLLFVCTIPFALLAYFAMRAVIQAVYGQPTSEAQPQAPAPTAPRVVPTAPASRGPRKGATHGGRKRP